MGKDEWSIEKVAASMAKTSALGAEMFESFLRVASMTPQEFEEWFSNLAHDDSDEEPEAS